MVILTKCSLIDGKITCLLSDCLDGSLLFLYWTSILELFLWNDAAPSLNECPFPVVFRTL